MVLRKFYKDRNHVVSSWQDDNVGVNFSNSTFVRGPHAQLVSVPSTNYFRLPPVIFFFSFLKVLEMAEIVPRFNL